MTANRLLPAFAAALVCATTPAWAQDEAGSAILILDGSGSMWGQIDGTPKIEIARQTLSSVLEEVPAGLELGLMAYGHNRRGDCGDIELLVPPAPARESVGDVVSAAAALSPKGKTPITEAVRQAAAVLRYTEERATVVLVTDGLETCEADPCAAAAELERLGIDFTAHVVGFGLTEEEGRTVACLAENTGGSYIQASDAAGLDQALQETVAPRTALVTLVALDQRNERVDADLEWTLRDLERGTAAAEPTVGASLEAELRKGRYLALVDGEAAQGGLEFAIDRAETQTIGVPVERLSAAPEPDVAAAKEASADDDARLVAPDTVDMGRPFQATWKGKGAARDWISIWDPSARRGAGDTVTYAYLGEDDNTVQLIAPARPGGYELRYNENETDTVLETRAFTVEPVETTLDAPASVPIGTTFTVGWKGPGQPRDYIYIWDPRANRGRGDTVTYAYLGESGYTVSLIAPAMPGDYELRYAHGKYDVDLASAPLEVTGMTVALDAPDSVVAEEAFTVGWDGPGQPRDYVAIHRVGEDSSIEYAYLGDSGRTVSLTAPEEPGQYELRYWHGKYDVPLATRSITVE